MSAYGSKSYNLDINQLGTSQSPRFSVTNNAPYKDGLVEDVIVNETHPEYSAENGGNIGMVRVRLIPDDRGVPKELLNWAMPIETTIREYPLKNEMVMIMYSVSRLFYTRRININNKLTESSWPGLSDKFSPAQSSTNRTQDVVVASQGGPVLRQGPTRQTTGLGNEFVENSSVRMLRPNEGDTIVQSRFGASMRFGSSLFSNPKTTVTDANLLITVGQGSGKPGSTNSTSPTTLVFEDINKDKSCIWMVSNEEIVLEPATINSPSHLRSAETADSNSYTGAQIFVNSDRVVLNSRRNEISLFSKTEINLSSVKSITLDSSESVFATAIKDIKLQAENDILIKGKTISFITTKEISYATSGNYAISGKKIFIGSKGDESQPMVLGGDLARWLQKLLDAFIIEIPKSIATLNPGPFVTAVTQLRLDLGLSTFPQSAVFNSKSNFTSRTN